MVKLAESSLRSFSSLMVANSFLLHAAGLPFVHDVKQTQCHGAQFHALLLPSAAHKLLLHLMLLFSSFCSTRYNSCML